MTVSRYSAPRPPHLDGGWLSGDAACAELPYGLVDFVRKDGKGIVFLHQSMVTLYGFKPWGELLGAYMGTGQLFDGTNAGKQPAVMKVCLQNGRRAATIRRCGTKPQARDAPSTRRSDIARTSGGPIQPSARS